MRDTSFTKSQEKAFATLVKSLHACSRAGLIVWDNYGQISAVNGRVVAQVLTLGDKWDAPIEDIEVRSVSPKCLHGAVSDDGLGITFR